ncbi:hypothetical protein K438DRAFT_1784040 [Mycena galopus ATCC 62051]|nr:hypothetical protein K438DRAFT_1784040 [Mycena galopus ATCC 62051]
MAITLHPTLDKLPPHSTQRLCWMPMQQPGILSWIMYLIQKFNLHSACVLSAVTLQDLENMLSELVATMFWTHNGSHPPTHQLAASNKSIVVENKTDPQINFSMIEYKPCMIEYKPADYNLVEVETRLDKVANDPVFPHMTKHVTKREEVGQLYEPRGHDWTLSGDSGSPEHEARNPWPGGRRVKSGIDGTARRSDRKDPEVPEVSEDGTPVRVREYEQDTGPDPGHGGQRPENGRQRRRVNAREKLVDPMNEEGTTTVLFQPRDHGHSLQRMENEMIAAFKMWSDVLLKYKPEN